MARRLQRLWSCAAMWAAHRHFRLQYVVVQLSMLRLSSCRSVMCVARRMEASQVAAVVSLVAS